MYQILVEYRTGDSFNTYDTEGIIDGKWSNIDICKENLQRIKEHYEWVSGLTNGENIPEFVKRHCKRPIRKSKTHIQIEFEAKYYIYLLDDNRKEYKVCTFWNGYFESLYGAKIIIEKNDGWSFSL